MIVEIEGLPARSALRAVIQRKLDAAFTRRRVTPVAVRIGFVDENGPKGGVDTRCGITVEVPRRRKAVHVERRAETPRLAFDAAFASLEREVFERERGRAVASSRRPKKYFVAQRLWRPDETLEPVATPPRRRRSA